MLRGGRYSFETTGSSAPLVPAATLDPRTAGVSVEFEKKYGRPSPRSSSSSVWTAPSPSQLLTSSPPSLPSLPKPSSWNQDRQVSRSPPCHQRTDSSAYYTALWGSPYEDSAKSLRPGRHQSTSSTIAADESPLRRGRLGVTASSPNQRRRLLAETSEYSLQTSASNDRDIASAEHSREVRRPRYGFTQDWLRTHLAHWTNSEKGNWWSDESGASDVEGVDISGSGSIGAVRQSILSSGTTAIHRDVSDTCGKASNHNIAFQRSLSQILDPTMDVSEISQGGLSTMEKPLPAPPFNRTVSEAPVLTASTQISEPVSTSKRPSASSSISFQRPRKRVAWRGKTCVIALPLEDGIDTTSGHRTFLKPEDVVERLAKWESQGYDTRGFVLSIASTQPSVAADGQSRVVYPDWGDWDHGWQEGDYRVSIPDRQAWENYVNRLKEEKLRALGVSFADEAPSSRGSPASPAFPLTTRQGSSQGLELRIMSPVIPSSTSSTRAGLAMNMLSPPFVASSQSNPQLTSIASPNPQYVMSTGSFHQPRHSIVYRGDQVFSPAFQFPQHQPIHSMSGAQPQQEYPGMQARSRGVSPAVNGQVCNDGAILPSASPSLPVIRHEVAQPDSGNVLDHMRQQQAFYAHQPNSHREQAHPAKYVSQPDIASPLPRGHRHNLSESLQKEIDAAEYHLEESIRRQLDEDDEQPVISVKRDGSSVGLRRINGSHATETQLSMNKLLTANASDLDTNPSDAGTPEPSDIITEPRNSLRSRHANTYSVSKLNVNAQEFKLTSKASGVFTFSGSSTFAQLQHNIPTSQSRVLPTRQVSDGSALASNLNVAAPAFMPANAQKASVPTREFSFSTSWPSFKPNAPVFEPTGLGPTESPQHDDPSPDRPAAKIFGDIDFSEVIKPVKKSKAIPIIKPEASERHFGVEEDASGHITQADGYQKRMRRSGNDGDQMPLFAIPSHEEPPEQAAKQSTIEKDLEQPPEDLGQHASPYEKTTGQLRENVDGFRFSASDASSLTEDHPVPDVHGEPFEPFEFNDVEEAASFSAALPPAPSHTMPTGSERVWQNQVLDDHDNMQQSPSRLSKPPAHSHLREEEQTFLSVPSKPLRHDTEVGSSSSGSSEKPLTSTMESVLDSSPPLETPSPRVPPSLPNPSPSSVGITGLQPLGQATTFESEAVEGVSYIEPSYDELDAVIRQLNEKDSAIGVERTASPWQRASPTQGVASNLNMDNETIHRLPAVTQGSDAPSPSPRRPRQPLTYLQRPDDESRNGSDVDFIARNTRLNPSHESLQKSSQRPSSTLGFSIHRLNSPNNIPISDWDDAVSSVGEVELQSRSGFFDRRVNDLIGGIVQQRLGPLEKTLATMNDVLAKISSRSTSSKREPSASAEAEHSDADDEDEDGYEEASQSKSKLPLRDRKFDKLKASLVDAISTAQPSAPGKGISAIMETLTDLKASIHEQRPASSIDIKAAVEEAVGRQLRGKSGAITSTHESAAAERYQLQITGLESMLKVADARAEDELRLRRVTEDALADCKRDLRIAQLEAAEQRESAEETERSLREFHDERQQAMRRTAILECAQETLQKTASELSEKNAALEETLEEYRLSSKEWREEIEEVKSENKNLDRTIHALKSELEEGIRGRHALRHKFDRLQEEMSLAARDIARNQSSWRHREEEHKARYEMLNGRLDAEARNCEKLELDVERLQAKEKEAVKDRFKFEQLHIEHTRLVGLVNELRVEAREHQDLAARYERELHDAKETGIMECSRVRAGMEAQLEVAKDQANIMRTNLDNVVARLQSQFDSASRDSAAVKERYETMLEEASDSRMNALREAAEAREAALQQHYRFHERTLEEMNSQHERAFLSTLEDKKRLEGYFNDRLKLSGEKIQHYQDKINHLEEKLEIAKSAAQAAIQAAQTAKITMSPSTSRASMPFATGSDIPERISPQALRESIIVLQEQLQEREGRIEELEHELAEVDKNAPAKIKDRDLEITWLRELLGVRIDDLQDIITTLSQTSYDRDAVKDAAIRLRANLQMEQQERERAMTGGQNFPSLSSITNLAASPRALPLAAAAAWGNWRKGRETPFEIMNGSANQTPSKSSPQSFLSGLLTPPNTNLRQTPEHTKPNTASRSSSLSSRPLRGYSTPRQSISYQDKNKPSRWQEPPTTPPLLRKTSYDQDAESGHYSLARYVNDDASTVGGEVVSSQSGDGDEPFGPSFGN